MNIFQKLKALIAVRKPAQELITNVKEIQRGYKTFAFWLTLVGSVMSVVGAISGLLPIPAALIATTTLTVLYNVLRGLLKADETGVQPILQSTEFWIGLLNQVSMGIVSLQHGGINPEWFATTTTVIGGVMTIAQNLAAQHPATTAVPTTDQTSPAIAPAVDVTPKQEETPK